MTPELLTVDFDGLRRVRRSGRGRRFLGPGPGPPRPRAAAGRAHVDAGDGAVQRARLLAAGLRVRDLPRLRDVDTAPTRRRWPHWPRTAGSPPGWPRAHGESAGRRAGR
ncbi:hypothetical protein LV779_18010 [Streptomyces thinghirensis]|nr:hypothetical protein [Streptomyces thinghirensis]